MISADFAGSHLAHEEGSGLGVGSSKNLDSAWCVLNLALSISNVISMEKASIFSAIGEVAFRKGSFFVFILCFLRKCSQ